ncbi:MAG: hypothetical protein K0Q74_959 [Gammaproteobacteria bacterium]|jgi:hypothetical protein|nr:hypothetical protein [Gammaproteobacteria bacterium]
MLLKQRSAVGESMVDSAELANIVDPVGAIPRFFQTA